MKLAEAYAKCTVEEVKAALSGATLRFYSGPQPATPDQPALRTRFLAEFTFAAPAFDGDTPKTVESSVAGKDTGVPLFARATTPAGDPIADFSAGPGDMDAKLSSTSCSPGGPVALTKLQIRPGATAPARPLSPRDQMLER